MITVESSPDCYRVTCPLGIFNFSKAQEAVDCIERNFPGQVVKWDIQPRRMITLGQSFATQIVKEYKSINTPP